MKIKLPEYVCDCISTLKSHGYSAYCVGGGIRDLLLGITPYDYDVATSAPPERVMEIFPKNLPTGLKHGTVTVITNGQSIEITTYRTDSDYADSRHPDKVAFLDDVHGDLERRDFTVNAIGYDGENFVFVENSFEDLDGRIIRAVGDAKKRFGEDALRIMRCFRFSAQLGFEIEEKTLYAATENKVALEKVSAERIAVELIKTLTSKNPTNANMLFESGMLEFMGIKSGRLPGSFEALENKAFLRLSAAFFLLGGEVASIVKALKLSNNLSNDIIKSYQILCKPILNNRFELKLLLKDYGYDILVDTIKAKEVLLGQESGNVIAEFADIINSGEAYNIKMLSIGGSDLISLGYKGEEVGKRLNELLLLVMKDPALNQKQKLIEISRIK